MCGSAEPMQKAGAAAAATRMLASSIASEYEEEGADSRSRPSAQSASERWSPIIAILAFKSRTNFAKT